jgi:hypothetical protein
MKEKVCELCGKKIEGYSQDHVNYLMSQHKLKHSMKRGAKNVKKKETS